MRLLSVYYWYVYNIYGVNTLLGGVLCKRGAWGTGRCFVFVFSIPSFILLQYFLNTNPFTAVPAYHKSIDYEAREREARVFVILVFFQGKKSPLHSKANQHYSNKEQTGGMSQHNRNR